LPVLLGMEMTGVCVDRDRLRDLSTSFAGQLDILEQQIYENWPVRPSISTPPSSWAVSCLRS
jgi:DNA polymerase I-like protein with 3'-5' exonuclease and polymerase domains